MKLAVFNLREDEKVALEEWKTKNPEIELLVTTTPLSKDNQDLLSGVSGVVISQIMGIDKEVYDFVKEAGVKVWSTRSAGFDMYRTDLLKEHGIKLTNVPSYSPNAIAEHAVATTLYLSRNIKKITNRVEKHNFSWTKDIVSRELRTMTVGIVGTGRIGSQAARLFKGLGANVLGYDLYQNEASKEVLTYVENLDDLVKEVDVISLHMPAIEEYKHMVNDEFISKMKDNSILVNAARGMLVDTKAVIRALDSGKLLGAALDVYENEANYVPKDLSASGIDDALLQEIIDRDDIIYTPHTAFYTETAIENLVHGALDSAVQVIKTGKSDNIVNI
ncbi:MAG: D-2-hydroxyacid dehydrogenase [Gemella sp.]|nr:D-2-hydroxyacid dehydrogenase [Gemella sp.]